MTIATARETRASTLHLAAAPGLEDSDVESVLLLEDRLLAGTAHGVYSYDGVRWTSHAFADTVRWLEQVDGQVFAGATRGVWVAAVDELSFVLHESTPAHNRVSLDELGSEGSLLVGTDEGLFAYDGEQWTKQLSDHRVQSIARHPKKGLLVGTWGDGLLVRPPIGEDSWLACPGGGVTDTLSGNYIHDIEVDPDGTVRLACSWGSLDPRYRAHEYALARGLVTARDPHSYLRASFCNWTDAGWEVTYLLQNYTARDQPAATAIDSKYVGALGNSSRSQWVISVTVSRRMHPRGLVSFDLETRRQNWSVALAAETQSLIPLPGPGGIGLISVGNGPDQGAVEGTQRDDCWRTHYIDGTGSFEQVREFDRPLKVLRMATPLAKPELSANLELLEYDPEPGNSRDLVRWRLRTAGIAPDHTSMRFEFLDSLKSDDHSWQFFTGDGRLVSLSANPTRVNYLELLYLKTQETHDLLSDSLRTTLNQLPRPAIRVARLPSGRLGAIGIDRNALYVVDQGKVHRWPNPVPMDGVLELHWGNLLRQDMPQLTVLRDGEVEWWSFDNAMPLESRTDHRPGPVLNLASLDLSGLRLRSRLTIDNSELDLKRSLAPCFNQQHELSGWLSGTSVGGSLAEYGPDGSLRAWLRLPPSIADRQDLEWMLGVWPDGSNGTPSPCLIGRTDYPWPIWRYDVGDRRWIGPYQMDLPFEEHHANAVTALSRSPSVWGSEQGLREEHSDSNPATSRVRGIEDRRRGLRLVWGSFGVDLNPTFAHHEFSGAFDLLRIGRELYANSANSIYRRSSTGWDRIDYRTTTSISDRALLDVSGQLWCQQSTKRTGLSPPFAIDPEGPIHRLHLNLTMFDLGDRQLRRLIRISEIHALMVTEWGLHLVNLQTHEEDPRRPLIDEGVGVNDIFESQNGSYYAAIEDGRVLRIDPENPNVAQPTDWTRNAAGAVEQFVPDGDRVWIRTRQGVELWGGNEGDVLQRWTLPDNTRGADITVAQRGGLWLATDHGLWRARSVEGLLLPARIPGLPEGSVSNVIEMPAQGESVLYAIVDGELWSAVLNAQHPTTRAETSDFRVTIGIWSEGPISGTRWALTEHNGGETTLTPAMSRGDGATVLRIPEYERGDHELKVWAISSHGTRVGEPVIVRRRVRESSPIAAATGILGPGVLLGLWALDLRRTGRFALLMALSCVAIWLVLYHGLLFDLPWGSTLALPMGVAGVGVALRRRESVRHIPTEIAVARLDELLRGYGHRGGEFKPVNELLISVRNVSTLHERDPDLEGTIRGICTRLLDATDDLSTEGKSLIAYAKLEPTLLRRFFHRLDELRDLCLDLHESRWRLREWLQRSDEHLACAELCASFLQAVDSLTELLARHRNVIVDRFFPEYCKALRRRSGVECEFLNESELEVLPVKQGEVAELLDNLVGNALRACESVPTIALRLTIEDHKGSLRIRFEDNGPGVPAEMRARIFDHDYSGSGSTGFGLTRCAQLVESWGATIEYVPAPQLGGAGFEVRWRA